MKIAGTKQSRKVGTSVVLAHIVATVMLFTCVIISANPATSLPYSNPAEATLLSSKPPGRYCTKGRAVPTVFKVGSPIVSTGYSYDPPHFAAGQAPDASLYRHPALMPSYVSANNPAGWYYYQLKQMRAAGLNMVMPVYGGDAVDDQSTDGKRHWAIVGLPPLVKADESLRRATGKALPIGMFYDTATLLDNADDYHADLSTPAGRAWFYVAIRNFYSCIPPSLRATVNGKPFVFICPSNYQETNGIGDPRVLDYVRLRFLSDFGVEPYLVTHDVWQFPNADAVMHGNSRDQSFAGQAVAFSPGWRPPPWNGPLNPVTDRARGQNGRRYRGLWEDLLSLPKEKRPNIVLLDSWNEWGNDTAIAPSREFGDAYVKITRHYADLFTGKAAPRKPGTYGTVSLVSLLFDPKTESRGITLIDTPKDGHLRPDTSGFVEAMPPSPSENLHLYFAVDDSFRGNTIGKIAVEVMIEYWDEGHEPLWFQYDSTDNTPAIEGTYKGASPVPGTFVSGPPGKFLRTDTKTWKAVRFHLEDASLLHGENQGADFRLVMPVGAPARVRWVTMRRI